MMTSQERSELSQALAAARPRPVSEVQRLYKPYYEELQRLNASQRDFIEKRDSPAQCYRWLVELDCGCVTDALTAGHLAAHVPIDELYPVNCVFERMLGNRESGASMDNALLFGWGVSRKHSNWREGYAWCPAMATSCPWSR